MKKAEIQKLIEPFLYDKLKEDVYDIEEVKGKDLLTWNRLDLALKLFYLDMKPKNKELAKQVYKEDIRSQTHGKFTEYGSESRKDNFEKYLNEFDEVFESIKKYGFDANKTIIPLCKNGNIINGSHRVASSIFLNENISCIKTDQESMISDYKCLFERNMSTEILGIAVNEFIKYSNNNTYIAFLWPSGIGNKKNVESLFSNIVYRKEIKLNINGAHNLLIELYKHMDWAGTIDNNFIGVKQKLIECFPNRDSFTVLVFQSNSIKDVREIKEKVRQVYNIGFSSIHITDTKEEAIRISKLIFNDNGLHFLNHAKPYKYKSNYNKIDEFKDYLNRNNINSEDVVLDGSILLSIYGLRRNDDIDFLINDESKIIFHDNKFDTHDSELKYHEKTKVDLIYNPSFHFEFYGIKFASFDQTYLMKRNRNELKDKNDSVLMSSLIENNNFKRNLTKIKQFLFYSKIKVIRKSKAFGLSFLTKTGLYKPVRFVYRKFKK